MPVKLGYATAKIETEKAVQFDTKEYGLIWIPKSVIHDDSETWDMKNNKGELIIHDWFAIKNGWL